MGDFDVGGCVPCHIHWWQQTMKDVVIVRADFLKICHLYLHSTEKTKELRSGARKKILRIFSEMSQFSVGLLCLRIQTKPAMRTTV